MRHSILSLMLLFLWGCSNHTESTISAEQSPNEPIVKIQRFLSLTVKDLEPEAIKQSIKTHYKILGLMDSSENWVRDELAAIEYQLLPDVVTSSDLKKLIHQSASNLSHNKYLEIFLNEASQRSLQLTKTASSDLGQRQLQDVITFAYALQKISTALRVDMNLLEVVQDVWANRRKTLGVHKVANLFEKAKLYSVEYCMNKVVKFHKTREVDPRFLKLMLPLNIVEANLEDSRKGMIDNADAGWVLSRSYPGKNCPENQSCEANFTEDGNGLLISLPEPKAYADLYQSWNMAFVLNYANYPYFLAKLSIPLVSGYEDDSRSYIYHRALALYTFIHYELFSRLEKPIEESLDWRDQELQKIWGQCNKYNAQQNYLPLIKGKNDVKNISCG